MTTQAARTAAAAEQERLAAENEGLRARIEELQSAPTGQMETTRDPVGAGVTIAPPESAAQAAQTAYQYYGFDPHADYEIAAILTVDAARAASTPTDVVRPGTVNAKYSGETEGFQFGNGYALARALYQDATEDEKWLRCEHLARLAVPKGRYHVKKRDLSQPQTRSQDESPQPVVLDDDDDEAPSRLELDL